VAPFPLRVVVTGSESTGKTTLAAQLARALGTRWVPEFSRHYAEQVRRPLTAADVAPIAHGQVAAEEQALAEWRTTWGPGAEWPPVVLDTDLVSTTVYAEHYYGECPAWILTAARERLATLYLLCEPDVPWTADGVRDQPSARDRLHGAFRDRLLSLGATVASVHGLGDARVACAMDALASLRA